MKVKKFVLEKDYKNIIKFLRERYKEVRTTNCWLPQKFDDLIYKLDVLYNSKNNGSSIKDFIYIWEEKGEIVALLLPGKNVCYPNVKPGFEYLISEIIELAEKELKPLFKNNKIDFTIATSLNLEFIIKELLKKDYQKDYENENYDNYQLPSFTEYNVTLPPYFEISSGKDLNEDMKVKACYYGLNPEADDGDLSGILKDEVLAYQSRKKSSFYKYSFENLIITKDGDICSYLFCYVDKETSTALIEPICTRRKYRHIELGKALLQDTVNKLKEQGIEKCYISSYGARMHNLYTSAGFITDNTTGYWRKKI